ncbi:MAG: hypothetical protein HQ546_01840 [Planctomycetes bacterium]|nr:hypothetical protein [Planctomycetota bacterium]
MDRRTRICLWVILLGLANFVAYVIGYAFIGENGGDAMNGKVVRDAANPGLWHYTIGRDGNLYEVGRVEWIYSAVHSISIWPTMGAVLLAMLTLAKDRIVSSMHSTLVRGRTFMTIIATLIGFIAVVMTVWFVLHMVKCLTNPAVEQVVWGRR